MLELWTLPHNICVMIRNIYLKFEVDTLKNKEVIIFLKENPKFKER
jgi:HD-like signal output (HDOD) protein